MELVGTAINATVVAGVGLIRAWLGKGRFAAQARRMERLEERVESRIDGLQASFNTMRSELQTSIDTMRSDLTQVALAVGVRRRATNS